MKGFQKLTSADESLSIWFNTLQMQKKAAETIPLDEATNRVLAEDIVAEKDLPSFDRSAVDGYAVNSEITAGATQFKPVQVKLTMVDVLGAKEAKQVWTGNPIPKGADAVLMIENTQKCGSNVEVWMTLAPWDNIVRRGEDVKKGEILMNSGIRLNPYHLGVLAALGRVHVKVAEKPSIAILATGNELASKGTKLKRGQVYDSNRTIFMALCRELGAEPLDLGICNDDLDEIAGRIRNGLDEADVVLTTGGTSVGGLDLVPDAINKLGKPGVLVHGIALRPGMPTALAVLEGKPIIVLSGNPVAAIVGFEVFARPLICQLLGMAREEPRQTVKAIMTRRISTTLGRKTFVRVRSYIKNGEVFAETVSARGSGSISTMTRGNGFVIVPEDREGVIEGETVLVHLFGPLEQ